MDTPTNLVVVAITALAGFGLAATAIGLAGLINGSEAPGHALAALLILALLVGAAVAYRRASGRRTRLAG